jgi:transposase-like protein
MMAIRWHAAYSLSYRDVKELLKERGIALDYAPIIVG